MSLGSLGSPGGLEGLRFLRVSEATYISLGFGTFFLMYWVVVLGFAVCLDNCLGSRVDDVCYVVKSGMNIHFYSKLYSFLL